MAENDGSGPAVRNGQTIRTMFPREGLPFNYNAEQDPREFMFGQRIKPLVPAVEDDGNGKARGGMVRRTSGPPIGKDTGTIPAQRGEFVVRKSAVEKLGTKALEQVNRGQLPHPGASPRTPAEHMAARHGQGVTYRELAAQHGVSASTAHRKVRSTKPDQDMLRRGFTRNGSAY